VRRDSGRVWWVVQRGIFLFDRSRYRVRGEAILRERAAEEARSRERVLYLLTRALHSFPEGATGKNAHKRRLKGRHPQRRPALSLKRRTKKRLRKYRGAIISSAKVNCRNERSGSKKSGANEDILLPPR